MGPHTHNMPCPPQNKMAHSWLSEMETVRATTELSRQGKLNWGGQSGQGWAPARGGSWQSTGSWEQGAGHRAKGMGRWARDTGDEKLGMEWWAWGTGAGWDEAVPPLQYHLLPQHYQFLLVTAFLILTLAEGSRLYLGYVGNLQEKVSALSLPWPQVPCAQ